MFVNIAYIDIDYIISRINRALPGRKRNCREVHSFKMMN
jgi:hypothetical protein